ncbi:hypothetical protein, partial [Epibacterium ulvae]|uniref:hypothetical protein n=1 Tax=Epibacterium ulvae TaxID=1156985 RepID=UPI002492C766
NSEPILLRAQTIVLQQNRQIPDIRGVKTQGLLWAAKRPDGWLVTDYRSADKLSFRCDCTNARCRCLSGDYDG